jgi:hypothetical protein
VQNGNSGSDLAARWNASLIDDAIDLVDQRRLDLTA